MFTSLFPKTQYDLLETGRGVTVPDIFRYVKPVGNLLDDISVYSTFNISNGYRPDQLSTILYGTPDFYWTFFVINDHLSNGMISWYKNSGELNDYIQSKYSGKSIQGLVNGAANDGTNLVTGFQIGETVQGTNGATAVVTDKQVDVNLIVVDPVDGNLVEGEIITGLTSGATLVTSGSYTYDIREYYNAPRYYYNIDTNEKISFVDCAVGENEVPYTNTEYEEDLNEKNSIIRIVRKENIFRFRDAYMKVVSE